MSIKSISLSFVLVVWFTALTGCAANRGEFGAASCRKEERASIPKDAVIAHYFTASDTKTPIAVENLAGISDAKGCLFELKLEPTNCRPVCWHSTGNTGYCSC